MPIIRRAFNTGPGAIQWPDGNNGIVSFAAFDAIPRNTRVAIHRIAWFTVPPAVGNALGAGGIVSFLLVDPQDTPNSTIVLRDAIAGTTTDPNRVDRSAAVDLGPTILPRRLVAGNLFLHYQVECHSSGLVADVDTTLLIDYDLEPWPDTDEREGVVVVP